MLNLRRLSKSSNLKWVSLSGIVESVKPTKIAALCSIDPFLGKKVATNFLSLSMGGRNFSYSSHAYLCTENCSDALLKAKTATSRRRGNREEDKAAIETSNGNGITTRAAFAVLQAQRALMDYLHYTRSLNFTDAEHMSKRSPYFLAKLLKRLGVDGNGEYEEEEEEAISKALTWLFHYHPINEFEPFFDSIALKPG